MKKYNWIAFWLLGTVTFGIYPLIVWYGMTKQHNELAEKYGTKKIMGFIGAFLLGMITCGIYIIVWYFLYNKQVVELAAAKGVTIPFNNTFVLTIMLFVPIYSFYLMCDVHNKLVDGE